MTSIPENEHFIDFEALRAYYTPGYVFEVPRGCMIFPCKEGVGYLGGCHSAVECEKSLQPGSTFVLQRLELALNDKGPQLAMYFHIDSPEFSGVVIGNPLFPRFIRWEVSDL